MIAMARETRLDVAKRVSKLLLRAVSALLKTSMKNPLGLFLLCLLVLIIAGAWILFSGGEVVSNPLNPLFGILWNWTSW